MKCWSFIGRGFLFSAILLCHEFANGADPNSVEDPRSYGVAPDNSGLISAPVVYEELMLIAVTRNGVAAIIFDKPIENGIQYRFRYLANSPNGAIEEIAGKGNVFERYTDGKYDGGNITIRAGSIKLGWSRCGDDKGWVYYKPEELRLQIASAERFDDQIDNADDPENVVFVEKLDLRRFFKQP